MTVVGDPDLYLSNKFESAHHQENLLRLLKEPSIDAMLDPDALFERRRAFFLAWPVVAAQVAGELAKGFGEGFGKAAAERLFGSRDSLSELSQQALHQINELLRKAFDENEMRRCLVIINGIGLELNEWKLSPTTHPDSLTDSNFLLNTQVIPMLEDLGVNTLGTYIQCINSKLTVMNLIGETERSSAKAVAAHAISLLNNKWIPELETIFRARFTIVGPIRTGGIGTGVGGDGDVQHPWQYRVQFDGSTVWPDAASRARGESDETRASASSALDRIYLQKKKEMIDEPFLNDSRKTIEEWEATIRL